MEITVMKKGKTDVTGVPSGTGDLEVSQPSTRMVTKVCCKYGVRSSLRRVEMYLNWDSSRRAKPLKLLY